MLDMFCGIWLSMLWEPEDSFYEFYNANLLCPVGRFGVLSPDQSSSSFMQSIGDVFKPTSLDKLTDFVFICCKIWSARNSLV